MSIIGHESFLSSGEFVPRLRCGWLDSARGFAIILVVYAHVVISLFDAHLIGRDGFLGLSSNFMYTFHMAAFMLMAGLFVDQRLAAGRRSFLRSIVPTLVWPYLVWGSLALLAMHFGHSVRNAAGTVEFGIHLLWTPIAWLWFLWALTLYHLLAAIVPGRGIGLFVVGCILYPLDLFIELPPFVQQLTHFMLFYALGVVLAPRILALREGQHGQWAAGAVIILISAAYALYCVGLGPWSAAALPAALAGTALIFFLALQTRDGGAVAFLGRRSLPIYICHMFFLAAARIILVRWFGITAAAVHVATEFTVGIAGPLVLYWMAERLHLTVAAGFGKPIGQQVRRAGGLSPVRNRAGGAIPGPIANPFLGANRPV